ncbi:hypothetical protein D3C72_1765580 [compost metagenome]
MPATAPWRVVPRQKMPSTITGTKADAASENDADTMGKISDGLRAATNAADSATASKVNLVKITRCSGDALRCASGKYRSRTSALLMVSSNPSAVDNAAARPPAATRPDTT